MKTKILLIVLIGVSFGLKAQNTFPTNGNAGIGTDNPNAPLHIRSASDGILTLQSTDDIWLYTNWLDKSGTRRTYMGLSYNLSQFRINLDNGTNSFTINGGDVGIGTTNPTQKLEIADGFNDGTNPPIFRLTSKDINAVSDQLLGEIQFYNMDADGTHISSFIKSLAAETYGRKGQLLFGTSGTNSTDAIERMRIDENGNIGIGTTNPFTNIQIHSTNTDARIALTNNHSGNNSTDGFVLINENDSEIHFLNRENTSLKFSTYGTERMRISANGNIGIGTTTPGDWKLAVNGKIRAKEIKVETGWSDFVFEKDYYLPTLTEVEKHIKEKGHLQDIPSAKEVEKNGIFLGEMDAKLLQKIEELTLYTIQQEKKIKKLESLNDKLLEIQKRLEKLENK